MKLNKQTLKSMTIDELYNILKPSIDKLFKEYNYMKYSTNDLKKIIINNLNLDSINLEKINDNKLNDYLDKHLKNIINQDVSRKILSKNGYRYIVSYIEQNFHFSSDYTENIKQLKKISNFFVKINFYPTLELMIDVLKNSTQINQVVQEIVDKNIHIIQSNRIELLFENENSALFIYAYCATNQIEISEEDNYDYIDENTNCNEDIVKTYLSSIPNKLLTIEEEQELATRVEQGDKKARDLMIKHNLKLVVSVAKKYLNRGLDFLDLIQEGNAGLIKAIDNYDLSKGYKFSTYAMYWIKQSITRAIHNLGRNIRVPVHYYKNLGDYNKAIKTLRDKLNREPILDEIADYLCISIEEVNKLYILQQDTISINSKVDDYENTELGDFISDEQESPEEYFINKNMSKEIKKLLIQCNLSERMNNVLIYRYGLDGSDPKTLEEIGQILGVTRERVRQIELNALNKIKLSPYIKDFAIYMQNPDKALDAIKDFRENYSDRILKCTKKVGKEFDIMPNKLQTIYELLNTYSKDDIDAAIKLLNDDDRLLLVLANGRDLEHPVRDNKWSSHCEKKYFNELVPKLSRLISVVSNNDNKSDINSSNTTQDLKSVSDGGEAESDLKTTIDKKEDKLDVTDDYLNILKILNTPIFHEVMNELSAKEAVIVSLKLGYVDEKYFSNESIANFLQISPNEVNTTIKHVLLTYKDYINKYLDKAINLIDGKEKTYKK